MIRIQTLSLTALLLHLPAVTSADNCTVRPAGYVVQTGVCYRVIYVVPCSPSTPQPMRSSGAPPLAAQVYATPTIAPPSKRTAQAELAQTPALNETAEPPPAPAPTGRPTLDMEPLPVPKAAVSESKVYYEVLAGVPHDPKIFFAGGHKAGFHNLRRHEVHIKVNGTAHVVGPFKNISLSVKSQFTWQVVGRDLHIENIPVGETSLEILIRR